MDFNISLTACSTPNCTIERNAAASIGSLNADFTTNDNANNNGGDNADGKDDFNIFLAIGLGVGLMGITTAGAVYGLRKFIGEPPEEISRLQET